MVLRVEHIYCGGKLLLSKPGPEKVDEMSQGV